MIDEDVWQWRQKLKRLHAGASLDPDPGLIGDWEYIPERYKKFKGLAVLGAGCGTGRIEAKLARRDAKVVCLDHLTEDVQMGQIHAERKR
jgi:2-polyprenyl-3-methyl-5-hydroxy-6-metoxy-1,4-benzoquinol methylase